MSENTENGDALFTVENNIIRGRELKYKPHPRGLGFQIMKAMKHHKDKVAQYIADTGEEDTFQNLLQRSIRTAIKIRSLGIKREDVLCICSNNHKNTCVPYIAAVMLGMKTACLDPTLTVIDTDHLLHLVKPKIIFANNDGITLVQKALKEKDLKPEIVAFDKNDSFISFDDFLVSSLGEDQFEPVTPENLSETVCIIFSSGTTGLPKGICLSHYSLMVNTVKVLPMLGTYCYYDATIDRIEGDPTDKSVYLCYSAFYWISASLLMLSSLYSGAARIIPNSFNYKEAWMFIQKYKVTLGFPSPGQCIELARNPKPDEKLDTSSLRVIITGGGIIPSDVLPGLEKQFPTATAIQVYGATEMSGMISCFMPNNPLHKEMLHSKPESCGVPVEGITYKVIDLETEEALGPYKQGELRLKSKEMCTGYYNTTTQSPFDSEGWIKTGDLVYYDDQYCFFFVDRLKEMLKYKSYQVVPAMLEQVIFQHRAVKGAVVVGIPHPEDGDHPAAVIILNENSNGVSAEDIKIFVNERVEERQKLRGGVKLVKEFPTTPSGKVNRRQLRQMMIANKV